MDSVNVDLREMGLSGEERHNSSVWTQMAETLTPHRSGKTCGGRRSSVL